MNNVRRLVLPLWQRVNAEHYSKKFCHVPTDKPNYPKEVYTMKDMSGFHITDELVDRVVQLMKVIDPEKANPEYCRAMLEYYQSQVVEGLRQTALNDPDAIEGLYEAFEKWQAENRPK